MKTSIYSSHQTAADAGTASAAAASASAAASTSASRTISIAPPERGAVRRTEGSLAPQEHTHTVENPLPPTGYSPFQAGEPRYSALPQPSYSAATQTISNSPSKLEGVPVGRGRVWMRCAAPSRRDTPASSFPLRYFCVVLSHTPSPLRGTPSNLEGEPGMPARAIRGIVSLSIGSCGSAPAGPSSLPPRPCRRGAGRG